VFLSLVHQDLEFTVMTARIGWSLRGGVIGAFSTRPLDRQFLQVLRETLARRAQHNGMPASELPVEYH
jgi:hypothetical protein